MEAAFKSINPSTSLDDCQRRWTKPALCLRGRKHVTCVINDDASIHLVRVPVADYDRYAQPLTGTPKSIAEKFMAFTCREVAPKPITQGAREVLERVISGSIPAEDIEFKEEPDAETAEKSEPVNGHASTGLLATICSELKIEPTAARRKLRKAGLHAPYEDEKAIRTVLK